MMECKRCGNNDRVIKYGIKAGRRHLSQRWFCYRCRRLSYTPLEESNNNNMIIQWEYPHIKQQQQEKTERQLLKLAGRSAFAAIKRRSGYFAK